MPLDEVALRRSEFVEGVPIRLCDGRSWTFPRPILDICPVVGEDGVLRFGAEMRGFGDAYDRLVEGFRAKTGVDELDAMLALAADLLGRNYDLQPADFGSLLRLRPGDATNAAMWQAIVDVALGRDAPKAESAGSP